MPVTNWWRMLRHLQWLRDGLRQRPPLQYAPVVAGCVAPAGKPAMGRMSPARRHALRLRRRLPLRRR